MKHILILLTVITLFACNNTGEQNQTSNTAHKQEDATPAKGQSTVQDENSAKNLLQVALGSKDHTTLVAAVKAAGLEDVLVNAGPITVFAPNNAAFGALPAGTVAELVKPENKAKLSRIIKYHASPGNYQGNLFRNGQKLYQASGHYIDIVKDGDKVTVGGANILGTVQASNGVVHVIDKVLLPPE